MFFFCFFFFVVFFFMVLRIQKLSCQYESCRQHYKLKANTFIREPLRQGVDKFYPGSKLIILFSRSYLSKLVGTQSALNDN